MNRNSGGGALLKVPSLAERQGNFSDLGVNIYCYVPHQTVVNVTGGFNIGVGTAMAGSMVLLALAALSYVLFVHQLGDIGMIGPDEPR